MHQIVFAIRLNLFIKNNLKMRLPHFLLDNKLGYSGYRNCFWAGEDFFYFRKHNDENGTHFVCVRCRWLEVKEQRNPEGCKHKGRVESWQSQPSLIKPCEQFSRTRLSDTLHTKACAFFQPADAGTWKTPYNS